MSLINSKPYWNCMTWEIHQKISMPDHQTLKTMVKRSIDQKLRLRNFVSRNERIEKEQCQHGVERGQGECYQWKAKGQCSRGDKCSFGHDENKRAKPAPKTAPPSEPPTQRGRSASRKKNLRGRSPSGKFARQPCRDYLNGICTKSPCDHWHPTKCQFYKIESGCNGKPSKNRKNGDKSAVAFEKCTTVGLRISRHRAARIFIDFTEEHKVLGSIRRVQHTKATQRLAFR